MMTLLKVIILVMVLCGINVSESESQAVRKIVGGLANCDSTVSGCNPIPLTGTLLCDGTGAVLLCPQYFSPDWTDTTGQRFYGITALTCVKSINGGVTWTACTTNPFSAVSATPAVYFAVAGDGSLVASRQIAASSCEIKRSIDGGVTWGSVYTNAFSCNNNGGSTPSQSMLKCDRSTPNCVFNANNGGGTGRMYVSSDYGASWTISADVTSMPGGVGFSASMFNGTKSVVVGNSFVLGTHRAAASASFGAWGGTLTWNDGTGTIPYSAPVLMGSTVRVVSVPTNAIANNTVYTLRDVDGTIQKSFTPPVSRNVAQSPNMAVIAISANTVYMVGNNTTNGRPTVWVTLDGFASIVKLLEFVPSNLFTNGVLGDIYYYSGAIFVSSGGQGGAAQLMKIS